MRRGTTLPELLVVVALLGVLALVAVPRLALALDRAAVRRAADRVEFVHRAARLRAQLTGRPVELVLAADSLVLRDASAPGGPVLLRWPGPAAEGVVLEPAGRAVAFGPNGLAAGAANASYRLRRGRAEAVVAVSRLGRARRLTSAG